MEDNIKDQFDVENIEIKRVNQNVDTTTGKRSAIKVSDMDPTKLNTMAEILQNNDLLMPLR